MNRAQSASTRGESETDVVEALSHEAALGRPAADAPWAGVSLADLFAASVQANPHRMAFRQPDETGPGLRGLSFGAAERAIQRCVEHFADLGLQAGQILAIAMTGCCEAPVMILAALRAGLSPCLVSPDVPADVIETLIARPDFGAVVTLGAVDGIRPAERWRTVAAMSGAARFVLAFGDRLPAGVVRLDGLFSSTADAGFAPPPAARTPGPAVLTVGRVGGRFGLFRHEQEGLVAAGLLVVLRAGMASSQPVLTTLSPCTHAALATGLLPALITGGTCWLVPAFRSALLLRAVDSIGRAHIVAPAALEEALAESGLRDEAAATVLVHRPPARFDGDPRPSPSGSLIDVLACGEHGLLAARRGDGGMPALAIGEARIPDERGGMVVQAETGPGGRLYLAGPGLSSRVETQEGTLSLSDTGLLCRVDGRGRILAVTPS